jgi:pyrroline-5-carboxylate reductase
MSLGTLGVIGYGTMGSAIVSGLVKSSIYMPSDIHIHDIDGDRMSKAKGNGHFVHPTVSKLASSAGTIIIAVKPKDINEVLHELKDASDLELVISIAAGKSIAYIESVLGAVPVVRVMPNTPAMVGAGVCVISKGTKVLDVHVEKAKTIMSAIGFVTELPEMYMDAVTGLSGSGPAYVALMIEAMSDGGVKMGLPRQTALKLAAQTVFGTAKMILVKDIHPSQLKDMVASPGGATIEGIAVLEEGAFRGMVIDAVEAAAVRSKELGLQ